MKRYRNMTFLLSILMVAVMGLAACTPANTTNNNTLGNNAEVLETPADNVLTPGENQEITDDTQGLDDETGQTPGMPVTAETDLNRLSNVLGHSVVGTANEDVGQIESVLVDSSNGQIVYALINGGDAIDITNDLVAVPWSQLEVGRAAEINTDTDVEDDEAIGDDASGTEVPAVESETDTTVDVTEPTMVYTGDLATLESAPSFASDELDGDIIGAELDSELNSYWSNEVASLPQTGTGENEMGLVRLIDISDKQLTNADGEDLGDIEDMVIDPNQGMITYVILASGGFLDIGENLIPVPFERLQFQPNESDANESDIILNVNESDLENAPRIENLDAFPDTTAPNWDEEYNSFWEGIPEV